MGPSVLGTALQRPAAAQLRPEHLAPWPQPPNSVPRPRLTPTRTYADRRPAPRPQANALRSGHSAYRPPKQTIII